MNEATPARYPSGTPAWKYKNELFPRTSFPAGVRTEEGFMLDMQTGEVNEQVTQGLAEQT